MTPTKKSEPKPKEPTSASAPTTTAKAAEPPKPMAATPTTQPQPATKQTTTITKMKEAWLAKGINLDQLTERQDGKFVLLQPTPDWPIVRVGPTGGMELPQIRSYAKAWDAAIDGLAVWQKQQQRDQKKAASSAPTPAPSKPQSAPAVAKEAPAVRKQKEHNKLEAALA